MIIQLAAFAHKTRNRILTNLLRMRSRPTGLDLGSMLSLAAQRYGDLTSMPASFSALISAGSCSDDTFFARSPCFCNSAGRV